MENIEEINKLTDLLRRSYQALIYKELNTDELRKEISDNIYTLSIFKHQDAPKLAMPDKIQFLTEQSDYFKNEALKAYFKIRILQRFLDEKDSEIQYLKEQYNNKAH